MWMLQYGKRTINRHTALRKLSMAAKICPTIRLSPNVDEACDFHPIWSVTLAETALRAVTKPTFGVRRMPEERFVCAAKRGLGFIANVQTNLAHPHIAPDQ